MPNYDKLIKKIDEAVDLLKADPKTKLPGILVNKAVGHVPTPATAPNLDPNPYQATKEVQPKSGIPLKAPASPKPMASKLPKNSQMHMNESMNKMWPMVAGSEKDEKGVHKPLSVESPNTYHPRASEGVSGAGVSARGTKDESWQHAVRALDSAISAHKQKLAELKNMPKPNLPKSEDMNKMWPMVAGSEKDEKGVHTSGGFSGLEEKGQSQAGRLIERGKQPQPNEYYNRLYHERGKHMHRENLKELKNMPKPNLPKSEEMNKDAMGSFGGNSSFTRSEEMAKSFKSLVHKLMNRTNKRTGKPYTKEQADKVAGAINAKYVHHYRKSEEMEKKHIGWNKLHSKLEDEGYSKESADKIAGKIKADKYGKSEDMNKYVSYSGTAGNIAGMAASEKNPPAEDPREIAGLDKAQDPRLRAWLKKAVGCMHKCMAKSDYEKERMTDGNVANVRREEIQEEQRAAGKDMVNTHKKVVAERKDDAIKDDKGHSVTHPGRKLLVPDATKNSMAFKSEEVNKFSTDEVNKRSEDMNKDGGSAAYPTSRIDTGFGRIIAKDQEGVQQPLKTEMGDPKKMGVSTAGLAARAGHKNQAADVHRKIFNTLKAMKKPNLP